MELQKMKNNKVPRPGLHIKLLKDTTTKALEVMCKIFSKCIIGKSYFMTGEYSI